MVALISDADNTLWDTDRIYAAAQLWLLTEIENYVGTKLGELQRLDFVRRLDQTLAAKHHHGLRYPTALLVNAIARALRGSSEIDATRDALANLAVAFHGDNISKCAEQFESKLRATPPLRPGVDNGLELIYRMGIPILVATEGSVDRCRMRLSHWGLEKLVTHVVSGTKTKEFFFRMTRLLEAAPENCFVVGDQLDRDIAMASTAGCKTIYFPGGFVPVWAPSVEETRPNHVVTSYYEIVKILERTKQERAASRSVLGNR
jgi:putative hydrolase of the HAD superfamily